MSIAIRVEHLSKKYILRHKTNERYVALRDVITGKLKNASNRFSGKKQKETREDFFALSDVSFDVLKGQRIGIIGRNGAGKTTLLKILSRITEPTTGKVSLKGRVASLLEVGTGFHPELTGRENIYLNGSILGMSKSEIKSRFDEIVEFSEVDRFLDTPVKRYSSGMYVRLAFSVAAHLEPEILVVDEVLAVGDAQFQRKCLGKMKDVSTSGRTILFVSHNMAAIQNLCDTAIYLRDGKLIAMGEKDEVISTYLKSTSQLQVTNLKNRKDRQGNASIRFVSYYFTDENGNKVQSFQTGRDGSFCFEIETGQSQLNVKQLHIAVGIDDEIGQRITNLNNEMTNEVFSSIPSDRFIVKIKLTKLPLKNGRYSFSLYATVLGEVADWITDAGIFDVEHGDFFGTGKLLPEGQGNFYLEHHFSIHKGEINSFSVL